MSVVIISDDRPPLAFPPLRILSFPVSPRVFPVTWARMNLFSERLSSRHLPLLLLRLRTRENSG